MENLKGKVAFVTGGSRGMGAAIAKRLATAGANVVFTHSGRNAQKAEEVLNAILAMGSKGEALVADNEAPDAIINALKATITRFGGIDILINNAGVGILKHIDDHDLNDFDKLVNIHIKAVFVASKFVGQRMKNGGRIITIGSNMADRVPFAGGSLYAMSKSALIGLTKGMARDLASKHVTVNLVQPGPIDTDMNPEDGEFSVVQKSVMAIKRFGTVEEVAELVGYLSSEKSQFITGTSITIDGGFNI